MTKGKIALVTGGAKRLGREIVNFLANNGYQIIITVKNSVIEAERLKAAQIILDYYQFDLMDVAQATVLIQEIQAKYGRIDLLINNASCFDTDDKNVELSQHLVSAININAISPILFTKAIADDRKNSAHIINILDYSVLTIPNSFFSYNLSKKLLYEATKLQALAFAPKVRVNAIAPYAIFPNHRQSEDHFVSLQNRTPLDDHGDVNEINEAILFLEKTKSITGQTIILDGGQHLVFSNYEG